MRVLRRKFIGGMLGAAAASLLPSEIFAEQLVLTPRQGEGPFYPDRIPLDTDNDLIIVNDSITPAVGEVTYLSGRILDARGEPIRGALVELWQADSSGIYLHTESEHLEKRDRNFQGFGRFLTGSAGDYGFRTIKPVPYTGRTPHIHFAVKIKGREKYTTQCYIKGHPQNAGDPVVRGITDPKALESVMVEFNPIKESKIGELAAKFDIVMDFTPAG